MSRIFSNILLGCVCWVVTRQYPEETFNLFNTKCYVPAWTPYLSSSILFIQQYVCQYCHERDRSSMRISHRRGHLCCFIYTVDLFQMDKHTVMNGTDKWYILYAALSNFWNWAHGRCCLQQKYLSSSCVASCFPITVDFFFFLNFCVISCALKTSRCLENWMGNEHWLYVEQ